MTSQFVKTGRGTLRETGELEFQSRWNIFFQFTHINYITFQVSFAYITVFKQAPYHDSIGTTVTISGDAEIAHL